MADQWGATKLDADRLGDAPLVDQALNRANRFSDDTNSQTTVEMKDELAAMRAELDHVLQSVQLLSEGATRLVRATPGLLEEQLASFIHLKPLAALTGAAALSYAITRRLLR
ncbi:MAG: hypothetical protein AAAB35_04865 [Phyllobacterium sp.]|uniref:hypothetical protein n=1 Tax=Phyllobacterium sp. TaxID=1871046 RepID=UPI0030EFE7AF